MEVTHSSERKQIKVVHVIKLQVQQKIGHTVYAIKIKMRTTGSVAKELINTLFCT